MNFILFDVVVALVLLFFLWRGYSKGLVLTLCSLLSVVVAFVGATILTSALTPPVSHTIQPIIEQKLNQTFLEQIEKGGVLNDVSIDMTGVTDGQSTQSLPIPVEKALEALKSTPVFRGFADAFQKALEKNLVSISSNAAKVISEYIALQVARIVLFTLTFILIMIGWYFFSRGLDLAAHLPVLSSLNGLGGAVVGLARGALIVYLVCWLLKGSYIPQDAIEGSYLLRFFCTLSPMTLLS